MKIITGDKEELNRFEVARIIGARSLQLSFGAPPLIEIPEKIIEPITLAKLEFKEGMIPLAVIRGYKED